MPTTPCPSVDGTLANSVFVDPSALTAMTIEEIADVVSVTADVTYTVTRYVDYDDVFNNGDRSAVCAEPFWALEGGDRPGVFLDAHGWGVYFRASGPVDAPVVAVKAMVQDGETVYSAVHGDLAGADIGFSANGEPVTIGAFFTATTLTVKFQVGGTWTTALPLDITGATIPATTVGVGLSAVNWERVDETQTLVVDNFTVATPDIPADVATSTITPSVASLQVGGGGTSTLVVILKDGDGDNLTGSGGTVTFAVPPVGHGTIGAVTDNGDGTYAATYTPGTVVGAVTITPSLDGVPLTHPATITLTVGTATQLTLTRAAAGAVIGAPFTTQPVVAVQDAYGNTVTTDNTTTVTASIGAGASLLGAVAVTVVAGVATFVGLGARGAGGGVFALGFGGGGLTPATESITLSPPWVDAALTPGTAWANAALTPGTAWEPV